MFGPRSAKEVRKIGEEGLGKALLFYGDIGWKINSDQDDLSL